MSNIEWLLRDAFDERTLKISQELEIDDKSWRATIERLQIGPGLRVFLTNAAARQDVVVEARDDRTDYWVGGQVTVSGRADIDFLDGKVTHASTDQALMFRPSGRRAAYAVKAGNRFHSAGYGLEVGRVVRLFDGKVPSVLRGLLDSDIDASRIVPMPGNRFLSTLAGLMFSRHLNGPLRLLMIEGAVIQLIAAQAAAADHRPAKHRPAVTAAERHALYEARRMLLENMREPPTLGELATAVGLTEKRLNRGFRLQFGATVFEMLRNECLEHARIALQSESVSLKEVAFRVGYNHVTNFSTAFAKRFGAPPGQYGGRGYTRSSE